MVLPSQRQDIAAGDWLVSIYTVCWATHRRTTREMSFWIRSLVPANLFASTERKPCSDHKPCIDLVSTDLISSQLSGRNHSTWMLLSSTNDSTDETTSVKIRWQMKQCKAVQDLW